MGRCCVEDGSIIVDDLVCKRSTQCLKVVGVLIKAHLVVENIKDDHVQTKSHFFLKTRHLDQSLFY